MKNHTSAIKNKYSSYSSSLKNSPLKLPALIDKYSTIKDILFVRFNSVICMKNEFLSLKLFFWKNLAIFIV